MTRVLILIVLAWILYQIIKRLIAYVKAQDATQNTDKHPDEKMLQCTQCGCHVPESDTKVINDNIVCNNPECNKITHGD